VTSANGRWARDYVYYLPPSAEFFRPPRAETQEEQICRVNRNYNRKGGAVRSLKLKEEPELKEVDEARASVFIASVRSQDVCGVHGGVRVRV